MTYRIGVMVSALGMLLGLVGCGDGVQVAALDAQGASPLPADEAQAQVMAAARQTLSQMHFVIDKYDVQDGYLLTRPLRAGQFFEPWRQDNASATAFVRANLDSLQRTVEIFVEPVEGQMHPQVRCVVTVEKLSIPPQPIRSMSQMAHLYTGSSRRAQTLILESQVSAQAEWIDLGVDSALEQRILKRIEQRRDRTINSDNTLN